MNPAMLWWKLAEAAASCGPVAGCGPRWRSHEHSQATGSDELGSSFGVRRPLRFLAYKLDLDERQVGELAAVLAELKTERAQAEVDNRRTLGAFADAVAGEGFDEARAVEGAGLRLASAERLRDAVLNALRRIHALLDKEQRSRLAYLIRTGTLAV